MSIECGKCHGALCIFDEEMNRITCPRCNGMGRLFGKAAEDSMLVTMAGARTQVQIYFEDHYEPCVLVNFHIPTGDTVVRRGRERVKVNKNQIKGVKYP